MRKILFILLFYFSLTAFSTEKKSIIKYDTTKISSIKKANPQIEKEIFSDKDFVYHKDAKPSKGWWEAFLEWLGSLFDKSVSKNPKVSYSLIKYLIIAVFVLGLIFIVWKSNFINLLTGNSKKINHISFNELPENIEGINIDALIADAIKKGNYRLAVRWSFLKTLQWLNHQNKIAWQPAKTNVDYQAELKDVHGKEEFISLSRVFEYVWYGETIPTEKLCIEYKNKVDKFISTHV